MAIVAGDILRTTCNFALADGTLYQNIYQHKRTGVGILSDAVHVAAIDTWATDMYDQLIVYVDNSVTSSLCYVDKIAWSGTEWAVTENIGTFTLTFTPTDAFDQMPNQLSPFVIFKTNRPRTVGKKFLFPLCEDAYTVGRLIVAATDDIVLYADDAVNDIVIQVGDNLVPGVTRVGVDDWQEFYVAIVSDLVGTQRRRRLGYGA